MIRVDATDALLHDLRNALGLLVGLAANLRDGLDGPVNEVQRAHAQRIVEVGVDAGAMLERLASADAPVDPAAAFDLGALARSIVGRFDAQAAARGLRVTVSADGDDVVTGDRLALSRAVENLVGNAFKYTPDGGAVAVAVRRVEAPSPTVELSVDDSGPGIPAESREDVLDAGVRLPRDRDFAGEGLGLAIASTAASAFGGSVHVVASPLSGARVSLRIPCTAGPAYPHDSAGKRSAR